MDHRRLEDRHLSDISKKINCWEDLASYLELSQQDIAAIKRGSRNSDQQKTDLLRRWRRANGERATYRMLLEAAKSSDQQGLVAFIKSLIGR